MKRLLIIFLLLSVATTCFALTESFGPKYDEIVIFFQGDDEPGALDAMWESKSLLKIGVFDNSTGYDSYAEHACEIIKEKEIVDKNITIQIIDIKKLAQHEEWVVLGSAQCQ
ncbi:hypothetical protein SAMN05660420_02879 [Desulfuromusa kysingii]|uniref:Uncharacterized protein n=1 Tax=Desulfuromusa kysingii TaxID=37625 RepID=A0A1H4DBZ1_9BACT|nr:hypothetical protein [Desulfuromusa kysingii]SEA70303.1 hypothetical protein SAMN05660420_02879 [Desulfuromusa kysingii]